MFPLPSALRLCLSAGAALWVAWAPPAQAQPSGGITPEWDVRKNLTALAANAQRLQPMLEQIKPQDWISQGAPEAYVAQLKSTREQVQGLVYSTEQLTREPEKLTAALDALFRIETLDALLRSLGAGVRKYQNPALADLLLSAAAEGAANRERLRQYIADLAADKEQQFKVMDQEAQRCRAALSRKPPEKSSGKKEERR